VLDVTDRILDPLTDPVPSSPPVPTDATSAAPGRAVPVTTLADIVDGVLASIHPLETATSSALGSDAQPSSPVLPDVPSSGPFAVPAPVSSALRDAGAGFTGLVLAAAFLVAVVLMPPGTRRMALVAVPGTPTPFVDRGDRPG
jgi:hypothetical protein